MSDITPSQLAQLEPRIQALLDKAAWYMEAKETKDGVQLAVHRRLLQDSGEYQIIDYEPLKGSCLRASQPVVQYILSNILDDMGNPVGLQELVAGRITYRGRIPLDDGAGHKLALMSQLLTSGLRPQKMEIMAWRVERMTVEETMYWLSKLNLSVYGDRAQAWARIGLRVMLAGPSDQKESQETYDSILDKLRR